MKNIAATDATPSTRKPPSIRFFWPLKSAIVPSRGEITAIKTMATVVQRLNHWVARSCGIPAQATFP